MVRVHQSLGVWGRWRYLAVGLLVAALPGCSSDDMADLKEYVAQVKSRHKGLVEPLPEVKMVEPYLFNPEGLRDPFVPDEKAKNRRSWRWRAAPFGQILPGLRKSWNRTNWIAYGWWVRFSKGYPVGLNKGP